MRRKLFISVQVLALVVVGTLAGVTAGKVIPSLGVGDVRTVRTAGAQGLSVQPAAPLVPVGNGFTYQGRLMEGTSPANREHDFQFTLYDAPTEGTQVGGLVRLTQTVSDGLFTVLLDFGTDAFNGDARYLEIAVGPSGGTVVTLSPRQPITPAPYALYALKTKGYKNVVVVSPEGGDFTLVQAALDSITDNSSTNKHLVWVGPGTYTETVTMKEWVDIEGSGEKTTKITFTGSADPNTGTVVGASNAELRSLAVENTGGGANYAIAIYNNGSSPTISGVTATVSGGLDRRGVYSNNSSPWIKRSTISAAEGFGNYGIYASSSGTVTIDDSKITGSTNSIYNGAGVTTLVGASHLSGGGVFNGGALSCTASYTFNGTANEPLNVNCAPKQMIDNVVTVGQSGADFITITAALNFITDNSATNKYVVRVAPGTYTEQVTMKEWVDIEGSGEKTTKITFTGSASETTGTVVGASNAELRSLTVQNTGGNLFAIAIYNNGASPSLLHVTAMASGGAYARAIYNNGASPSLLHVTAMASGGANNNVIGVYNVNFSSPSMNNVTATASGGTYNYGVLNSASSPRIQNSNISASGGTVSYGVTSSSSGTVTIDDSKITGSTYTIYSDAGTTTRVGASQLSGGNVFNGGTLTCSASYDENYVSPGLNVCP